MRLQQPAAGKQSSLLFDLGAELYALYTDNPAWRASCAALADELAPPVSRVLDLGCGPGTTIVALAPRLPGATWIGGDLARRMLALARRRLRHAPYEVALLRLDALRLPFAAASVDAVVGHSFLYLVPDDRRVLAEARRVLRPGGCVAFMEPAVGYVSPAGIWRVSHDPRFLLSVPPWRWLSRRERRYSASSFRASLTAAGFTDVSCRAVLGGLGIIGRGRRGASS